MTMAIEKLSSSEQIITIWLLYFDIRYIFSLSADINVNTNEPSDIFRYGSIFIMQPSCHN